MRNHPRAKPHHVAEKAVPEIEPEGSRDRAQRGSEPEVEPQDTAPELQVVIPPYATPALMRVHRQAYRNYIIAGGTPMTDTPPAQE